MYRREAFHFQGAASGEEQGKQQEDAARTKPGGASEGHL
jgi:hypothetical protein